MQKRSKIKIFKFVKKILVRDYPLLGKRENKIDKMQHSRLFTFAIAFIFWMMGMLTLGNATSMLCVIYLLTGGHYTLYLARHTLMRDARGAFRYLKLLLVVYMYQKRNITVAKAFAKTVAKNRSKTCLLFEDTSWSFQDLEDYSNRVGNYFLELGYKPGDCVALFMENRPEYIGLWLGLSKVGVVPALINTNLQGQPLIHSIKAASATGLIFGVELEQAVYGVTNMLSNVDLYKSGLSKNGLNYFAPEKRIVDLDKMLRTSSANSVPESIQNQLNFTDKMLYIYTSGTTGLPKAAVIKHSRFYFYCSGMYYISNMGSIQNPVFYDPLPLYHSAGGIVGIGLMMVHGCTVVIRKKFSVRNFWKDCKRYNCNGAQYIGEICRYLLSAPETPEEKEHTIEIMFGNGLRKNIWNQFTARFGISRIVEFYGATEGNATVVNFDGKSGAVGFVSVLFPFVYPARLIRVNESGDVIRDPDTGLCVTCKAGETGEFVGKIVKNNPSRSFDGYVDKSATEKKIVRDVRVKNDMWFRSGDLLSNDEFGWMYFVDRSGDTYRWRGENVSTIEVEGVLSNVLQQQDTIVYGVHIPGVEGRAGMAAIVQPEGGIDLNWFLSAIKNQLPSYAMPIFLRMVKELDITGTFKLKKLALQREGYNPNIIDDKMFFYNKLKGAYQPLDIQLYNELMQMRCHF